MKTVLKFIDRFETFVWRWLTPVMIILLLSRGAWLLGNLYYKTHNPQDVIAGGLLLLAIGLAPFGLLFLILRLRDAFHPGDRAEILADRIEKLPQEDQEEIDQFIIKLIERRGNHANQS